MYFVLATVSALDRFSGRAHSQAEGGLPWTTWYSPVHKAFVALPEDRQTDLESDLTSLIGRFSRASDGTMVVPSDYLEVVVTKR